jgi:hypothetical protein
MRPTRLGNWRKSQYVVGEEETRTHQASPQPSSPLNEEGNVGSRAGTRVENERHTRFRRNLLSYRLSRNFGLKPMSVGFFPSNLDISYQVL